MYITCIGTVTQGDIHHSHSIENKGAVFNTAATQKELSKPTCSFRTNGKQYVVIRKQVIIEDKISF